MTSEITKLRHSIYWAIAIIAISIFGLLAIYSKSYISIQPVPPGSDITFDGKTIATTMGLARIITNPGEHQLKIESNGYISHNQTLIAKRGFSKTLKIELQKDQVPVKAASFGRFLTRGTDFNNGYYLGDSGSKIYRVKFNLDENGNVQVAENIALTDNTLSEINQMILSPTKELALFRKSDGIYLFDFNKYDFINQTERKWGDDIGSISWAPDNSKVAYIYSPTSGERSLIFSNLTNTAVERVLNLEEEGLENPTINFAPDSQYLTLIPNDKNTDKNNLYIFDSYNRKLKAITEGGKQKEASFSPDASKILYSSSLSSENDRVVLSVMDRDGNNKKYLDVESPIAKSAWSQDSKTVLAVRKTDGFDEIVKIDIESKQVVSIWRQQNSADRIYQLSYLQDGKIVIFETDEGIYALKTE